ncbi:hypothetical protein OHC33_005233 [Knufia fluminis]|uniref:Mediator of RNA polymerase II transcription subunit 19 n=1 Tax=Knufia fluminis TaxID=191047 RepID=A0AAN8I7Z6_9EURO|nr:hypothetical protein OHC33_005233 [Knufia fluminis]
MSYSPSAHRLPLSPASPPESGVKQQPKHHVPVVTPQTPPSPDSMSVATKRYVSAYEDGRHTNEMANRSPQNYQTQSQRPSISSSTPQPQNMLKRPAPQDEEERPTSKRQKKEDVPETMEVDSSHTATNHDRQKDPEQAQNETGQGSVDVIIDENTAAQDDSGKVNADLDPIFKDVGKSFRIGRTIHKRAAVDMNQNLLGRYGYHDLLARSARLDPDTGEKINKLRSSYAGQVRDAKLPGLNDHERVVRKDDGSQPSELRTMATLTDQEFASQRSQRKIGDLSTLHGLMKDALHLEATSMGRTINEKWDRILGHEAPKPTRPQQPAYARLQQSQPPNGVRPAHPVAAAQVDQRASRGKKRSYRDDAFDGYRGYGDGLSEVEEDQDRGGDYVERGNKRRKG